MVREQGPGVYREPGGRDEGHQAGHQIGPIGLVAEERPALESADHPMVEDTRGVQAGLPRQDAWSVFQVEYKCNIVIVPYERLL